MSSSLTRLFKKREPNARHGNEGDERLAGGVGPRSSPLDQNSRPAHSHSLGTGDEYADPWDVRSVSSSPSQARDANAHPLYPSSKGGSGPSSGGGGAEESSYSAPFSVLAQHNNNSRPGSPKLGEMPSRNGAGKNGMNDDYQDPFDARLRQAAASGGGGGGGGLHADHHASVPPSQSQQRGQLPRGSFSGRASSTTTSSEYDTPVDSLAKRSGSIAGGMADHHSNYSLPADTLRSAMAEHAGDPTSNYAKPHDSIRPSTSDLGVGPASAGSISSAASAASSDYSNPADHIPDIHRQASPVRPPPRYSEFRMGDGARTPSDTTANHLVASSGSTSSGSRQQHVSAAHPDMPAHHGGGGSSLHHPSPVPYHAGPQPPLPVHHAPPPPLPVHHGPPPPAPHHAPPPPLQQQQHHPVPAPVQQHHGGSSQREALCTCKWFHGAITRDRAEMLLRSVPDCSFLVRVSESSPNDYSLSVRNSGHPLHLKINRRGDGTFVLGQNSKPFMSIIDMIQYYERHKLLIKGAEHIFLEYVIPR